MTKSIQNLLSTTTLLAVILLFTCSCNSRKFHINGTIADAKDSTLYLENISLNGPVAVDSVKLDENGGFKFQANAPDAPEFYRLRIAGQAINLSVDSTETIDVNATYPTMATQYEVKGSANCDKIKELALLQMNLQAQVNAIAQNPTLGINAVEDSVARLLESYKDHIRRDYIFKEPMKAYAYYALFQTVQLGAGNTLIFNPRHSKDDVKVFAAVATSWDTYYPNAERGANLHNIAIEGMKNIRIVESKQAQMIDPNLVSVTGVIDLSLLDNKRALRHLTDLKGKVVLLDFHLFANRESTQRIMSLRDLYNKYHAQGLEIYQVSIDPDEHFWKTQTAALPWVSVRDDSGSSLNKYNVQSVPTFFLIDRENILHKRDIQIKDLDAEIKSLL